MRALRIAGSIALLAIMPMISNAQNRPRARDLGVAPGVFDPGPLNAITDVEGVRVGQVSVMDGDSVRTGVTAILPHSGNLFLEPVPAAIQVGNGFGKLIGYTQVRELGELETPILLTCTLCVWKAASYLTEWMLEKPGMERVRSINPLVGETNDGTLNVAIRSQPITRDQVRLALDSAHSGSVDEGSVGAGTGTRVFEWKGGIGTSSRKLPATLGGWTVGVLVQSNFGGVLQILGAPVGKELDKHSFSRALHRPSDGSIMVVVATDAPLSDRNLGRLATRALIGVGRTGSDIGNGSGDYVIAFSTAMSVRRKRDAATLTTTELGNTDGDLSGLFEGVIEATEEAIYNSMFKATTVTSRGGTAEALPIDKVKEILAKYGIRAK